MRAKHFRARLNSDHKKILIDGPSDLEIEVDFDDVGHRTVREETRRLVAILNERWEEGPVTSWPDDLGDDDEDVEL